MKRTVLLIALCCGLAACGKADDAQRRRVELGMKQELELQISAFQAAAEALERVAPMPASRGWNTSQDAQA
ncbi:MAG TPA: hypothetical protein VGC79_01195, partial [Polyangiaceae bacterium]